MVTFCRWIFSKFRTNKRLYCNSRRLLGGLGNRRTIVRKKKKLLFRKTKKRKGAWRGNWRKLRGCWMMQIKQILWATMRLLCWSCRFLTTNTGGGQNTDSAGGGTKAIAGLRSANFHTGSISLTRNVAFGADCIDLYSGAVSSWRRGLCVGVGTMESVGTTTKAVITIATMIANMIIGTRAVTIMTMPTVAAIIRFMTRTTKTVTSMTWVLEWFRMNICTSRLSSRISWHHLMSLTRGFRCHPKC